MNKRVILLKDVFCKQFRKQITQLFLVGAIGLVPISAFAQVYQITMKKSNAPLSSVIAEIEKESGYTFFYNDDQINLGKKISIDVTDASLDVVLNHMFKNTGYVYRIVNNQIVVSKSSEGDCTYIVSEYDAAAEKCYDQRCRERCAWRACYRGQRGGSRYDKRNCNRF